MKNSNMTGKLNAVIRIDSVFSIPCFNAPWQNREQQMGSGSGVVISGKRILTNAHNVADSSFITVRKQSEESVYEAKVVAVDHECDLALLRVVDESFFQDITPLEIGTTPAVQSEVQVAGYPLGGVGMCITQGIISRIEEVPYAHSGRELLAAQLDAAINPGNSGGPVLCRDKVVGIAFQGLTRQQNIGYMIPTEIIRHFLVDLENGRVDGFPTQMFSYAFLENPDYRRFLKMKDRQTGVLIYEVSEALGKDGLRPNDVLLSIDGHRVANNGNVRINDATTQSLLAIIRRRQIGETIDLQILRKGREMFIKLPIVKQECLCPAHLYDITPEYFILGGLVFTPLTGNMLDELTLSPDYYMEESDSKVKISSWKKYYEYPAKKPGDEIVLLHSVLADEVTIGQTNLQMQELHKVNGKVIRNMCELARIVDGCRKGFITFTFKGGFPVTFDVARLRAANQRILERYRVPSDRSANLAGDASAGEGK